MTDNNRRAQSASHYTRLLPTRGLNAAVALAAQITGCPIAMINVVDGSHQYTVAAYGINNGIVVPVDMSGCAGVIARGEPAVITDAVHNNDADLEIAVPLRAKGFRAYVGVPLLGREGLPVATLCVLDHKPRSARNFDAAGLKECAVLAGEALEAARSRQNQIGSTVPSSLRPYDSASAPEISVGEVASAVDCGQIVPWYMPIVDLHTGEVMAVEALARWMHPSRGLLFPEAFVPLIENTDLIIDFDLIMLTRTLGDRQRWPSIRRLCADPVKVAVNFSAHHFYRPDCVARIDEVAAAAGAAPESIILEITETVAVPTAALIDAKVINNLQDRGYIVVFDDIGGPWLPAEHLLSFGVDGLKADRTVGSSLHTSTGRALARALTALTNELGQFLVIEGIETAEHVHQARTIGARFGQGYYWSPAQPVPALHTSRSGGSTFV